MKNSQVGIEFMHFVGIAVFILLIYLILSSNYISFTSYRKDVLTAQNFLEELRNEINLAGRVENGYSRIIKLPKQLNGKDYEMKIEGREIYIEFPKGKEITYSRILATDVLNPPITFISGSSYIIKKENEKVGITLKQ